MNLLSVILLPIRNIKTTLLVFLLLFCIVELLPLLLNVTVCPRFQSSITLNLQQHDRSQATDDIERTILLRNMAKLLLWRKTPNSSEVKSEVKTQLCEPQLSGRINVSFEAPPFETVAQRNPKLRPGGRFWPDGCQSEQLERIAIIIPYRNRDQHLRAILNHLHPILQRQQLDYQIFVVEQDGNDTFNKALLMDIAFKEVNSLGNFGCFIFHDVDLFLEDDRGIYYCADKPVHLSEYIDKFNYEPYGGTDVLYGGVVSIKSRLFELVNGYSTVFFGWGAEDEEMRMRLRVSKVPILTPNRDLYKFKMVQHGPDVGNPWNENGTILISQTAQRMWVDGLNSLRYKLLQRQHLPTHTHLLVNFIREDIYEAVYGERTENLNLFNAVSPS